MAHPVTPTNTALAHAATRGRRADLGWGVRRGMTMAAIVGAFAAAAWLLGSPDQQARLARGVPAILGVYAATGLIGGLLIGVCRSQLHRRAVALSVGAVVGTVFILGIFGAAEGATTFSDSATWLASAIVGVPLGVGCAAYEYSRRSGLLHPPPAA
jgi:hypothetical protein